jgi:hypothetical protein
MVWNSQFEEAQSSPAFVCFLDAASCDASFGTGFRRVVWLAVQRVEYPGFSGKQ